MKHTVFAFCLLVLSLGSKAQVKPDTLDLNRFSGKWYVLASIPGTFDQDWTNTTQTFTLTGNGNVDIYMTYVREGETRIRDKTARGFPYRENKNTEWEVQLMWPFTSDYVLEELDPDYSYAVIGNPQKLYFYIINRTGVMDEKVFGEIMARYMKKGYEMNDLKIVIR